ncbi:MAG: DnaD domain protein [Erysipelotrichaceae bacterium]|nr:DnaD domain protein [Erysipelotrichaceae bacterium]
MTKWWNERYFNKRVWLLDNLQNLQLTLEEAMLLIVVDYHNEFQLDLSLNILSAKCNVAVDKLDNLINNLRTKGYLDIKVVNKKIKFIIDGIFDENKVTSYDKSSLYDLFENELGKILSQGDLRRINEWLSMYKEEEIINALREAVIYKKKNLNYIHNILVNSREDKND